MKTVQVEIQEGDLIPIQLSCSDKSSDIRIAQGQNTIYIPWSLVEHVRAFVTTAEELYAPPMPIAD